MKLFLVAFLGFLSLNLSAQKEEIPRFEKIALPECGCTQYMPKGSSPFSLSYSEDSSKVFTSEFTSNGGFTFGAIIVKLKISNGKDKVGNEELLISYMDFIKSQLGITASAGYGKGHTMEDYPDAVGVIDYWEDANGLQFAVKGWNDGDKLAVLYLYGKEEYPYYNAQQMFFEGFIFE